MSLAQSRAVVASTMIVSTIVAFGMMATLAHADDEVAGGAIEFKAHCAACHGENGAGDGPAAAALRNPPPDLRLLARNNDGIFPEKVLETVIDGRKTIRAHGNFEMPVWGRELSQGSNDADAVMRVALIVQYLRGIQQK